MKVRKHTDNRGMSLVELLIAVVILAVIVAPVLRAFVMSAKVNARAKTSLRETSMAQDIMEGLKAYTVEDLAYQFNYPNGGIKEYSLSFNIVSPSLIEDGKAGLGTHVYELSEASGKFENVDTDKSVLNYEAAKRMLTTESHAFNPRSGGIYYFAIKNVTVADTGVSDNAYMKNSYVDILIKADATEYKDISGGATPADNKPNSKDLVDIPEMNSYIDSIYVENDYTATNNAAAQIIKNKCGDPAIASLSVNEVVPKLKKKIKIEAKTVLGAAKDGNDRYYVEVTTDYYLNGDTTNPNKKYETKSLAYDNIATGEKLQNIYLFYQPIYHNVSDYTSLMDEIEYNAAAGVNIDNLYIIRQGSLSALTSEIANYKCKVDTKSSVYNKVKTNLGFDWTMTGGIETIDTSHVNNTTWLPAGIFDPTHPLADTNKVEPLYGKSKKDRLYSCTVYLFEKGTIDDWLSGSNYDLDKCLTKVSGNMK